MTWNACNSYLNFKLNNEQETATTFINWNFSLYNSLTILIADNNLPEVYLYRDKQITHAINIITQESEDHILDIEVKGEPIQVNRNEEMTATELEKE